MRPRLNTAATSAPTLAAPSSQTPGSDSGFDSDSFARATATSARADVLLKFAPGTNIADVDDITDIVAHLKSTLASMTDSGTRARSRSCMTRG